MKVLFVASEALPFMASGGLGDVAGSLPAALRKRLIGCRVVMPLYDSIPQELKDQMQFITSISVPVAWRRQYCGIFEAKHNGVIYYLLDNQYYFKRDGIYGHYDDAERFARETGIDALACAFCTAHGLYLKQPKLDFDRLKKIASLTSVPLVMHGGSGVSHADYKRVIELGIRKINYYTYMAKAGGSAVCDLGDKTFYHDIELAAIDGMKADVMSAMRVFAKTEG